MSEKGELAKQQTKSRYKRQRREERLTRKITSVTVLIIFLVVSVIGILTWQTISYQLQPYNINDKEKVEIQVSTGATFKSLAKLLEDKKIIRSATLFNFLIKTKDIGSLKAGNYALSPSMTIDEIVAVLKDGGTTGKPVLAKILVVEGSKLEEIAESVAKVTPYTKEAFMASVQNDSFIQVLIGKYHKLLSGLSNQSDLKYKLEGYLFPATYDYHKDDSLEMIIESMVKKMDSVMSAYYSDIESRQQTVHQVLTIASLSEKEGVTYEDRQKIVSVFNNRLAKNMALQSDISILYALGVHKSVVTYADLEVNSPYNLYKHVGYGPGPFNSPSESAIRSVLNPEQTDYLYFVADIKTGVVYYAKTYEEHLSLVAKYVNNQ